MRKYEVIERLCSLTSEVMRGAYGCSIPADCFCGASKSKASDFQFSEEIIEFVENAVWEKIQKKTLTKKADLVE